MVEVPVVLELTVDLCTFPLHSKHLQLTSAVPCFVLLSLPIQVGEMVEVPVVLELASDLLDRLMI
jgi:hypothetical protein